MYAFFGTTCSSLRNLHVPSVFFVCKNLTFSRIASTHVIQSNRNLIFTGEILSEARQRIKNGESQRKVAAVLGTKKSTLRTNESREYRVKSRILNFSTLYRYVLFRWLKHFKYYVQPNDDVPVLLILDNHMSHCSLEAVTFADSTT
jgi:hypothetical protein